ncbi:hypothetical protein DH2020_020890 [Rehmannia glutinosa]|uniref:Disease resistance R13L4/SHOC-2-like LRR domain-containing protein n=1 Tax=Rehmannia glutinosa TaxID=99300 RepID=A0ABR0WD23_REHGL
MAVSKSYILAALSFLLFCSFKLSYCIGNSRNTITACPEIEKQALLSFKQSLKDPSNLFCSNLTGHVIQLHLQSLSGKINPSLLNLKHLRSLDLSQNNFEETIPFFIGSLTSLEYLNLSGAGFYGKIPHNIGNLSNLHTLVLKDNSESLEVDSLEWLSGLTKLDHLNMNSVNLNKATNWAQVINKLPSLVELHFSFCSLNNFRTPQNNLNNNITSLAILDLSGNFFQSFGVLRWIFQLSNLIFLDLNFNFFEGPIPSITNTSCKLQHIDLSNNLFNSTIPEWLYFCKGLEFVSLGLNHLQGTISKSIANMTSLKTLDLSRNELSGKIPREITNLCKMQSLDLHQNNLAGEISDSLGNMSDCFLGALEYLSLSQNQLSGHLTHQFGEFKSLRLLDLISNSLSGVIPNNLGNLSCLEFLYLSRNKLTGNLPESMGQLLNLKYFYISDNMLEGVVTETHFAHLLKLKGLYASTNQLTLKVVNPNWIPPFKLDILNLRSWNLGSGSGILSWIETQNNNMNHLDLSNTGISGNVPSWIWNIRFLNLSHNQLHGNIPVISEPEDGYQAGNTVTELDLSNNSFSGDISHFLCDTTTNETNRLEILHLGGNNLSGELPAECLMKWSSLKVLNLGNNYLFGRIPNSIGLLSSLQSLNLYGNKFSGHIPFSIQNCMGLVKIDLADNHLDGNITAWMGTSLSNLRFLILRSNKLIGEITSNICHLNALQILDLSDNMVSGTIPKCVDNFTAMAIKRDLSEFDFDEMQYSIFSKGFLESASITTKGSELYYDTILSLVTNIDLSKNNLSGDIPKEITNLVELRSLNLSGNHFSGLIPDSIGNMKQLESLDFSRNSLSGEIPSSFTIMSSLNYLNLSCNNLTGKYQKAPNSGASMSQALLGTIFVVLH